MSAIFNSRRDGTRFTSSGRAWLYCHQKGEASRKGQTIRADLHKPGLLPVERRAEEIRTRDKSTPKSRIAKIAKLPFGEKERG